MNIPKLDERKRNIKRKLIKFFTNKHNLMLLAVLLLAFIPRVMWFNVNEAVWWDEADYLAGAKVIGKGLDLAYNFNPRRPFFLSLFWGGLIALGANDMVLHFSVLVFSMIAVYLTYLIGKSLLNKNAGLIAAAMLSVFWLHLFHTARLLTDVVGLTFLLASVFYFLKGYVDKKGKKYIWLAGIFFGLSVFTRASLLMMGFPFFVLALIKDKWKILFNKHLWLAVILALLVISPFFIYLSTKYDNPIQKFTGSGGGEIRWQYGINILSFFENIHIIYSVVHPTFFILFIIGLIFSLDIFLGIDLLFKKGEKRLRKKLFILVFMLTAYVFFSLTHPYIDEPRYIFSTFVGMFIFAGIGLEKIRRFIAKYSKIIAIIIVILILVIGSYPNLKHANDLIKNKSTSYAPVKYAGEWLKKYTNVDETIISESLYQNMYYSERKTYAMRANWEPNNFTKLIRDKKISYVVVSLFEPGFTPEWLYYYPIEHPEQFAPVQAYYLDEERNQLALVIYKVLKH